MFGVGKPNKVIDVIEWQDFHPDTMVARFPEHGAGDFKFGSQLIVRESQAAVFFRDGKALDTFGPGRHTLSTANLPIIEDIVKKTTGGHNIFTAEVYFVNLKVFTDLKWGTPNPIDMKDPDLGWVQLRAFGSFSIRIQDPQLFINTLVGVQRLYTSQALNQFLKGSLRTHLNDLLGTTFESYAKIRSEMSELAAAMKVKVRNDFAKYGIELIDFFIQDVSVPEEIQEAFRMRARMGALGVANYTQYQAANAMADMAKNPGSGGAMMSAGMGMGMGAMFPGMVAQQMGYGPPGYPPPGYPPPGYPPPGYPPPGYPQGYGPPPGYPPQGGHPGQPGHPGQGHPGQQGYGPPPGYGPGPGQQAQTQACPKCNTGVPPGSRFCMNCGFQIPPPGFEGQGQGQPGQGGATQTPDGGAPPPGGPG